MGLMHFPANLPFTDMPMLLPAIYNRAVELAAASIPTFPQEGRAL
jgi:hypothetical protein